MSDAASATYVACEADLELLGLEPNDHLGFAIAGLGPDGRADWDGDGTPDILIGAYQKLDVPNPSENAVGSATLVLGPWTFERQRPGPARQVHLRVQGERGSRLGRSVAWLGDLDGDGRSDFAAGDIRSPGSAGAWSQRGVVRVFLSGDASTGLDPQRSRRASAAAASLAVLGEEEGHRFGHSLAGVGDVDGDGTPDVLVGAPGSFQTPTFGGKAYVLSGARLLAAASAGDEAQVRPLSVWQGAGAAPLDAYGYTVANVDDGVFAVGAPELTFDASQGLAPERSLATNGPGYVTLVDRIDGGEPRERVLSGEPQGAEAEGGEWLGFALGAADLDGDGAKELLVGAPGWSGAGDRAGRARAFALEDLAPRGAIEGARNFEMVGWSVGGYGPAADGDADGPERFAVGDFGFLRMPGELGSGLEGCDDLVLDKPIPQAGRLRVFAPRGGELDDGARFTVVGERNADSAGATFAYLGDLNGAGGDEVVLTVFRWDEPPPNNDVGKVVVFRDAL